MNNHTNDHFDKNDSNIIYDNHNEINTCNRCKFPYNFGNKNKTKQFGFIALFCFLLTFYAIQIKAKKKS